MSLRSTCPCDVDGVCPYEDMHSGYMNSCEYWCGADEPEDVPETWDEPEDVPETWDDEEDWQA